MSLTDEGRVHLKGLLDDGRPLSAYQAALAFGLPHQWQDPSDRILAARLVRPLGAMRLSRALIFRAYRSDPAHPDLICRYGFAVFDRFGAIPTWRYCRRQGDLRTDDPDIRSSWLALQARVAALGRDFETAECLIAAAQALLPEDDWLWAERAVLLDMEDRQEEALEAARESLSLSPCGGIGTRQTARLLLDLGRDDEALALLSEAAGKLEWADLAADLAMLQVELGLFGEAGRSLDRFEALSPLREKGGNQWLACRRSELAFVRGDDARAAEWAEAAGGEFWKAVATRLRGSDGDRRRVVLNVPYLAQDHFTCGPTTLTALARYWAMPIEHDQIVEQIWYHGTSDHAERRWALRNDFVVREFSLTWESATALLDRGVPLALTTTEPTSSHLQALVGYDARRRLFWVRDWSTRYLVPYDADEIIKAYEPRGPRAMAIVPSSRAALLDGLVLPDADLHDRCFELREALERHDRPAAQQILDAMAAAAPNHRLTLGARWVLAQYDHDESARRDAVEALLRLYPKDASLLVARCSAMSSFAGRLERLGAVEEALRVSAHPWFPVEAALLLLEDPDRRAERRRLLWRACHGLTPYVGAVRVFADDLWNDGRRDDALELYRLEIGLAPQDEDRAMHYFRAAHGVRQAEKALQFLKGRHDRYGAKSSQPVRTLFQACNLLERMTEGFEAIENALKRRPDDGDLILFAAECFGRYGRLDRAASFLETARGKTPEGSWLSTAAWLARWRGEWTEALRLWREVLRLEPLNIGACRQIVFHLSATGRIETLAFLREQAARFPQHYDLHCLYASWLREGDPEEQLAALRHMLQAHPLDGWAVRELALAQNDLGRQDEALPQADLACRLDPRQSYSHSVRGQVLAEAGRADAARDAFREALRLDIDNSFAMRGLMRACADDGQRREALAFLKEQMVTQVTWGDALLEFRDTASDVLPPEDVLAIAEEGFKARPDLWQHWTAMVRQLSATKQADRALETAAEQARRFPFTPQAWVSLATVHFSRDEAKAGVAALQKALEIGPGWDAAVRHLADAYEREGRLDLAREVVERALRHNPTIAGLHGYLADYLWKAGEKEGALAEITQAVRLDSGYGWAWSRLRDWSEELKRPKEAETAARARLQERSADMNAWWALAEMPSLPRQDRLEAIDNVLRLRPRNDAAHDLKATLLAEEGRWDEALAACRPSAWGDDPPLFLKGRAAWVKARRDGQAAAVDEMKAIVRANPTYQWGWRQLADWCSNLNGNAEYLEAAEQMEKLAPDDPAGPAWKADALSRLNRFNQAIEGFRKAYAISPGYAWAGINLFDLLVKKRRTDEAEEILQKLESQSRGPFVWARRAQQAGRKKDRQTVIDALRRIGVDPETNPWPLKTAAESLVRAGGRKELDETLRALMADPQANPQVGAVWVEQFIRHRSRKQVFKVLDSLLAKQDRGDMAEAAVNKFLDIAADKKSGWLRSKGWKTVHRFVGPRAAVLRSRPEIYGQVGYALVIVGDDRGAIEWLGDFSQRAGVRPWMLFNLALALLARGQWDEARHVAQAALLLEEDNTTPLHHTFVALVGAVDGRLDEARAHLAKVRRKDLDEWAKFIHALADSLLCLGGGEGGRAAWRKAKQAIREAERLRPAFRKDRFVSDPYGRTIRRMARVRGGPAAWLWMADRIFALWLRS